MRHDFAEAQRLTDSPETRTIQRLLGAVAQGRFEDLEPLMTEDAELMIRGLPEFTGYWTGRKAVLAATQANYLKVNEQRPEIVTLIQQPGVTVALVEEKGIVNGVPYHVRGTIWYFFDEQARIKRVEQHHGPRLP